MSALHQLLIQTAITLPFAIGFFIWIGLRQEAKTKQAKKEEGGTLWYGDESQEEVRRMLEEVQDPRRPYNKTSI